MRGDRCSRWGGWRARRDSLRARSLSLPVRPVEVRHFVRGKRVLPVGADGVGAAVLGHRQVLGLIADLLQRLRVDLIAVPWVVLGLARPQPIPHLAVTGLVYDA